ncbi:MAG: hypothetical protein AAF688_07255 [Bacteroidota bacterium]
MVEVYVFKTSVKKKDLNELEDILNSILPNSRWNFDLEDCDNILRIESETDISQLTCSRLKDKGYFCKELE